MGTYRGSNGQAKGEISRTRILVIEDEIDDARFALDEIESLGAQVQAEATPYAERALELLSQRRFDAILLDYRLPRMDGVEFVRELRERGVDVPTVVLTRRGSGNVEDALFEAGVDAYIRKEEGYGEQLRTTLASVLEEHQPAPSS